ncbi:hypothetical protein SERLA73DRAFT_143511 [Serpula lacrymans var. lacrymans S7.3]|uniref:Uncharacterized protein n=1 Tax=Serpula lacrymans var. lacrymans (strain S7.3) TaxID=936435 RepID=F8QA77_SERL3|nr:hypothetical protein SERLA73DRAFT_143511 [Serpula lacrymans var. lacrymans S7.3]
MSFLHSSYYTLYRPITTESDERDLRSLPPSAGEQVYTDCTTPQACDIQRSVKGF